MVDGKILIVDDNKKILDALRMLFKYQYARVTTASNPESIPDLLRKNEFDVILLDMNFRAGLNTGNEGIYWLGEIQKLQPAASVVMITAYGDINLAVRAVKSGAYDFVQKPWENERLLVSTNAAYRFSRSKRELEELKVKERDLIAEINKPGTGLVGSSDELRKVVEMAGKVADTDANVLITGENGTGKELLAREIHRLSKRSGQVMVTVDLGAIPESLFESELFGHEKGAFTDARETRKGRFELAHGGTLFLDEIGNLSLPMQAKLLSALESLRITRVGGNLPIAIDIRLICATNSDLAGNVREGQFREDLLYRINTIVIEMPPLRKREGDIRELARFFLEKIARKYNRPCQEISPPALSRLDAYPWPGNVRELQHVIERAVILSRKAVLEPEDFILDMKAGPVGEPPPSTLREMERTLIEKCLEENRGNLTRAAHQLGISRQTLYNKIKMYQ
jgi:DNA-binding NtrC family response regulator